MCTWPKGGLREDFKKHGMRISGVHQERDLVEVIELPDHPWFIACQFHPEFTSNPRSGHPLFTSYIEAAIAHARGDSATG